MADSAVSSKGKKVSTGDEYVECNGYSSLSIDADSLEANNPLIPNPADNNDQNGELGFVPPQDDGQSLQELIDSELAALRIGGDEPVIQEGYSPHSEEDEEEEQDSLEGPLPVQELQQVVPEEVEDLYPEEEPALTAFDLKELVALTPSQASTILVEDDVDQLAAAAAAFVPVDEDDLLSSPDNSPNSPPSDDLLGFHNTHEVETVEDPVCAVDVCDTYPDSPNLSPTIEAGINESIDEDNMDHAIMEDGEEPEEEEEQEVPEVDEIDMTAVQYETPFLQEVVEEDFKQDFQETQEMESIDQPLIPVVVNLLHDDEPFVTLHDESASTSPTTTDESDMEQQSLGEEKEKVSSKKKKSDGEGKEKKKKKSKKSHEKENISMENEFCSDSDDIKSPLKESFETGISITELKNMFTNGTQCAAREEIPGMKETIETGVSIKTLKSVYNNQIQKENEIMPAILDDELSGVSLKILRETYCNQAAKSTSKHSICEENIDTGVSIRELCQQSSSSEDISGDSVKIPKSEEEIFKGVSVADLRRSFGDLTYLTDDNLRRSSSVDKELNDIKVSVKALRASYGDLSRLEDFPPQENALRKTVSTPRLSKPSNGWRSSFNKFDQLSKKTFLHVRSYDPSKVQQQFSEENFPLYALLDKHANQAGTEEVTNNCKKCGKPVFQMELIKAEKADWHKNCFRCKECSKQLTMDIYSSHEGELYCKPHFKELFKPKAVVEDDIHPVRHRKPEMIIRESQPMELPPDVIRSCDKPDYGLEELSALNVKSKFQLFEKSGEDDAEVERSPSTVSVKRSASILSRLAKFQAKGMDIGVTDDSLNGIHYEETDSSSSEEEEEVDGEAGDENGEVVRSSRKKNRKERPVSFTKMDDIRSKWEGGVTDKKEELTKERKEELQKFRALLCMGKQGKLKEKYEQAVMDTEKTSPKKEIDIRFDSKSLKEQFERGETLTSDDQDSQLKEEDMSVFESGVAKQSRSLFKQLDATASQIQAKTPKPKEERKMSREIQLAPQVSQEVVRSGDQLEDVQVDTTDLTSRFKFFEMYKEPEKMRRQFRITPPREGQDKTESPEREVYRDPTIVRCDDRAEEGLPTSKTTSRMLSMFRQMEQKSNNEMPDGPKPLKRFTPPPDYTKESETETEESEEESDESEEESEDDGNQNPNIVRASDKIEDEFLKQAHAQNSARAKTLRAKFEKWEATVEKENRLNNGSGAGDDEEFTPSIDTAKNLRAKFEALKTESAARPQEKPRPKVNRFVEFRATADNICSICSKQVYAMEKMEVEKKVFHKSCFKCTQCHCILRVDSYTTNKGKLFCIPHFKQLFISKGNYDDAFLDLPQNGIANGTH